MPFVVETLDQLHTFLTSLARALLPSRDWSRFSFGGKFLRTIAGGISDLHANIAAARNDLMPDKAEGEYALRWGAALGVQRKAATPARKAAALRVFGTPAATVAIGDELTSTAGLRFQVNENETVPAAGYVDVDVVAIDVGSQTRLPKGEVLTFTSPPVGIGEDAELVLDLDEDGDDEETISAYRDRYLAKLGDPPLGGARADYEQWSLELAGIATAYVYPLRRGLGSVDVAALHGGTGTARLLTGGEIAELQAHLEERCPVDVLGSLRVLTVDDTPVDVEVLITSNGEAQYEFDWDDSTPPVVSAWNGTTRTLTFTTDRPDTMKAGDRLAIKPTAGGGTGEQYVIESLSSTNAVVLEEVPATAPVATDTVYSGGPLVDPVRDAILEHIAELGPSNTDAQPWGAWEANLRPVNLYRIVQAIAGVRTSTVSAPAATVEPADNPYPDDDTVFVLVPRRVLVRKG